MKKVPKVHERDMQRSRKEVEEVTSLGVEPEPDRPVFYLEVGVFHKGQPDGHRLSLALSPPAAKQVADLLNQSVDDYLLGVPRQETE